MRIFRWSGKAPQSMVKVIFHLCMWSQKPPEAVSGCQFQNFPGGAYPQTRYVWVHYHMLEFPPL